jgi:hypothetical protein
MNKLTTDLETADALLSAFEAYNGALQPIKKWYADVADILFHNHARNAKVRIA